MEMKLPDHYIVLLSEAHSQLGIFCDLEKENNVQTVVVKRRNIESRLLKTIRRLHTSWTINRRIKLPFKNIWYEPLKLDIKPKEYYCIVFVDTVINNIKKETIQKLCNLPNTRCVLVCINSIDAQSIGMLQIRDTVFQINWDSVYTFDPGDREKYGYKDLKNCYYSLQNIPTQVVTNDVFFVGGLKGGRDEVIFQLFEFLVRNGVKCEFYISALREQMIQNPPFKDKIHYYTGGWKPYEEILEHNLKANVIIEILQENQAGPSLRYYEAVCYNRKLITTNKRAAELPFFNKEYMKIIDKPEDIDVEWVKKKETVNYGYKGEFSPIRLLKVVLE